MIDAIWPNCNLIIISMPKLDNNIVCCCPYLFYVPISIMIAGKQIYKNKRLIQRHWNKWPFSNNAVPAINFWTGINYL